MEGSYLTFIISVVVVACAAFAYGWWNSWVYDREWKKNHPDASE